MTAPASTTAPAPITLTPEAPCPCASGRAYQDCCGPHLSGAASAPTAEALMRARYTAFAVRAIDFLEQSLLPETRGDFDRANVTDWAEKSTWTGLDVRYTEKGGPDDTEGLVEFVAHYRIDGKDYVHHETSTFVKRDGAWFYEDGKLGTRTRTTVKVGRNDPCPCGSGKKYKKCHGA